MNDDMLSKCIEFVIAHFHQRIFEMTLEKRARESRQAATMVFLPVIQQEALNNRGR
jgi:hypothetical protein